MPRRVPTCWVGDHALQRRSTAPVLHVSLLPKHGVGGKMALQTWRKQASVLTAPSRSAANGVAEGLVLALLSWPLGAGRGAPRALTHDELDLAVRQQVRVEPRPTPLGHRLGAHPDKTVGRSSGSLCPIGESRAGLAARAASPRGATATCDRTALWRCWSWMYLPSRQWLRVRRARPERLPERRRRPVA